jgi:hypothetical protein
MKAELTENLDTLMDYFANASSDINVVKAKVPDELKPYVYKFKGAMPWVVLQHPLSYAIPFQGGDGEIKAIVSLIERKKDIIDKAIKGGKPWDAVWLYERPWRFNTLIDLMHSWPEGEEAKLSETVGGLWVDSENIHQNLPLWKMVIERVYNDGHAHHMMDERDTEFLASLGTGVIDVFRGAVPRKNVRGLSWTVDESKARWFSRRYQNNGQVYRTQVNLETDVVAAFAGRSESELLLLPSRVSKLKITNA